MTTSNAVKNRIAIEKKILKKLLQTIVAQGGSFALHNGEETAYRGADVTKAMAEAMQTDEEYVIIYIGGSRIGSVYLVYGNTGWDVINDYTASPAVDEIMAVVSKYAATFET